MNLAMIMFYNHIKIHLMKQKKLSLFYCDIPPGIKILSDL